MHQGPRVIVLVVDDEVDILESTVEYLEGGLRHATVISAGDGIRAMEAIRAYQPHIVVTDYRMPGADGLAVLRYAADAGTEVTMMFTAFPDVDVATAAVNRGQVSRFFTKPYEPETLQHAVQEAIDDILARAVRQAAFDRATQVGLARARSRTAVAEGG